MRSKAQLHKRLGFRKASWRKSVRLLIIAHSLASCGSPNPIRFVLQVSCLDKRFLDLPDSLVRKMKMGVTTPVMTALVVPPSPVLSDSTGTARFSPLRSR